MSDLQSLISQNTGRITTLESELGGVKVEIGKIDTKLEFQEERSRERFEALNTAQIQMMDIMNAKEERDEARAREAREYRERRELFERESELQRQNWFRSLFTPQTIIIGLLIIGSVLGVRMVDVMGSTGAIVGAAAGADTVKAEP